MTCDFAYCIPNEIKLDLVLSVFKTAGNTQGDHRKQLSSVKSGRVDGCLKVLKEVLNYSTDRVHNKS